MLYLTKIIEFSAAHRLHNPRFDDEWNREVFDKCNNPNSHGHNYTLEVTISGLPDADTGYLIDFKKLKKIINKEIIEKTDHLNLNLDVEFLSGIIPTLENLIVSFWNVLVNQIPSGKLHKLKLWETPRSFVEYYGEETS